MVCPPTRILLGNSTMLSNPFSQASAGAASPTDHRAGHLEFLVDDNVRQKFPNITKIVSAVLLGTSGWTTTARLRVQFVDGTKAEYFLKSAPNDHGRVLIEGEFNAMKELYKWASDVVPEPHSFGKYSKDPPTYFFLSQYVPMSDTMPDPDRLCKKLAKLHRSSVSPNGQFGFHTTTCQGRTAQSVGWEKDWTTFFIKLLKHVIDLDFTINGHWNDLQQLEQCLVELVIPRLLDALCSDGRSIKPCLIHADLWEGNAGTSTTDGHVYLFDSAAFYAHNEMEIADWRCYYNKIADPVYTRSYLNHMEPSEPKEEWDDRNRLYSIYFNMIYSVNHDSQGTAVRQL